MRAKNLAEWAKAVKEIDECKCVLCGQLPTEDRMRRLESHHIEMRDLRPDKALSIDNGVTLCHVCHRIIHGSNYMTSSYPKDFMNTDFWELLRQGKTGLAVDERTCDIRTKLQEYVRTRCVIEIEIETELYELAKEAAASKGVPLNKFIREAIQAKL